MLDTDNIFCQLEEMPEKFYLTGSRFFGTSDLKSDFDFFVEDKATLLTRLENLGFIKSPLSYPDCQTISVFTHPSNIHVQIVKDARLKQKAQEIIEKHKLLVGVRPYWHKEIWNIVLKTIEEIL